MVRINGILDSAVWKNTKITRQVTVTQALLCTLSTEGHSYEKSSQKEDLNHSLLKL